MNVRNRFNLAVHTCIVLRDLEPFVQVLLLLSLQLYEKQHSSMGVFHVFQIAKVVPNGAKQHRW